MTAATADAMIPAPYRHALDLYAILDRDAEISLVEGQPMRVWSGHMTKVVTDQLGLSLPYYTKILGLLKAAGCIQQLQRGAVTTLSRWILLHQPNVELFDATSENGATSPTRQRNNASEQRVKDLNTRVGELEDRVALLEARLKSA